MARGRKRRASLFELMEPKGSYRAPALNAQGTQNVGQDEPQAEVEPAVEEVEEQAVVEPEPVQVEENKKPQEETNVDSESAAEPILAVNDGEVRLVTNYPLAAMLCFAALIVLICAALVGWRLGHDSALRKVAQAQNESRQEIPATKTQGPRDIWNQ